MSVLSKIREKAQRSISTDQVRERLRELHARGLEMTPQMDAASLAVEEGREGAERELERLRGEQRGVDQEIARYESVLRARESLDAEAALQAAKRQEVEREKGLRERLKAVNEAAKGWDDALDRLVTACHRFEDARAAASVGAPSHVAGILHDTKGRREEVLRWRLRSWAPRAAPAFEPPHGDRIQAYVPPIDIETGERVPLNAVPQGGEA
jgi:chromosome segregation ATPase